MRKNLTGARIAIISVCGVLLAAGLFALIRAAILPETEPPEDVIPAANVVTLPTETTTAATAVTSAPATTTPTTTSPPETTSETTPRTTRNIVTSRERKIYDENAVYIDMENILQLPELPTGCEITALTILLRYYGFDAEKTDLAANYLPTSWGNYTVNDKGEVCKDSFFTYFIGDPFGRGYGCFSPAIVTAAESYIADHGGGYEVVNISGCNPDEMYDLLIAGTPVMCWATDGMIAPEYYESWIDNATGERLDWYLNEHAFVLTGFNMSANLVTLNDPMKGIIDYNMGRFETRFNEMYSQAIYLKKTDEISATTSLNSTAGT